MRLAARLYPRPWRERYGAEFDALLEDSTPRAGDLADIVMGAAIMQTKMWNSYWRVALAAGVAGALLAGAASLAIKNRYRSNATLLLKSSGMSQDELRRVGTQMNQAVMSRDSLIDVIRSPELGLYGKERQTIPLEDIANNMQKDVEVAVLRRVRGSDRAIAMRVAFKYDDPAKARGVVTKLVTAFQTEALRKSEQGYSLEVLDRPSIPQHPVFPNRGKISIEGALAGIFLAVLTLLVWRHTRRQPA